ERLRRREREHVRPALGRPRAPAGLARRAERVGRDRQQNLAPSENSEILLLVVDLERLAHGGLGLGSRLPFAHGHPPWARNRRVRETNLPATAFRGVRRQRVSFAEPRQITTSHAHGTPRRLTRG